MKLDSSTKAPAIQCSYLNVLVLPKLMERQTFAGQRMQEA
jgi:hypothetical protein